MERSGRPGHENPLGETEPWRAPEAAVQAVCEGRHGDPFAVLGPHAAGGHVVIRAFAPDAEELSVQTSAGDLHPLPRRTWDGFFEGLIPGVQTDQPYRLHARSGDGHTWTFDDPYRFAASLGSTDDYLLLEGSHRKLYERLGAHTVFHQHVGGVRFSVWAPHANRVSVVGEFNNWDGP